MIVLAGYFRNYLLFGAGVYALLFLLGHLLSPLPDTEIFSARELYNDHIGPIILFSAVWVAVMVLIYLVLARRVRTDGREVFLHMGVIAMLGPLCEVAINTFCRMAFGTPLWEYHFLPVHNGDTSMYSFFVWAMYGCHLYFMDRRFIHTSAPYKAMLFALILSVDAVILEFVLNVTAIYFLHTYIFYYLPGDVHHLTTLAVVPFYFIGGLLSAEVLRRSFKHPVIVGSVGFVVGCLFTFMEMLIS